MRVFRRVRFWVGFTFPRWVLFRNTCLKTSYDGEYHCCLTKGHAGHCHGDVGFEERYRKAMEFYENARIAAEVSPEAPAGADATKKELLP